MLPGYWKRIKGRINPGGGNKELLRATDLTQRAASARRMLGMGGPP